MFVNLEYNPEDKVYNYKGVDKAIEDIRKDCGDEEADFWANLKWKDILSKVTDGVYSFWNINEPIFDKVDFKLCEWVEREIADDLKFPDYFYISSNIDSKSRVYVWYDTGVVDNWEQIFERVPNIKNYIDSKYKFVIFLYPVIKESKEYEKTNWLKMGEFYCDESSESKEVLHFRICRVVERETYNDNYSIPYLNDFED